MASVNVTIRMDEKLRKQGALLFDELGMGLNQAITIFVKQAVREQRIPFIISNVPNKDTLEAFNEVEKIKQGDKTYTRYDNVDNMIKDILKWSTLSSLQTNLNKI